MSSRIPAIVTAPQAKQKCAETWGRLTQARSPHELHRPRSSSLNHSSRSRFDGTSSTVTTRYAQKVQAAQGLFGGESRICGDVWLPTDRDRWKLHFNDDELVWLCPECDEGEFGDG